MNVIDLFCGAGGLSEGFRQGGFNISIGIDFNKHAINTHHHNFPESVSILGDITQLDPMQVLLDNNLSKDEITGIIGGFPCQGFSIAGRRWIEDPRNQLFKECVRFLNRIKPKFFVFENVQGLVSMDNGRIKDEIIELLSAEGYKVDAKILTATDYGVPQLRKRVFFIGFREDIGLTPTYPKPNNLIAKTVGEAIMDLPKLGIKEGSELTVLDGRTIHNHVSVGVTPVTLERFAHIPEGGNSSHIPTHLQRNKPYQSAFRRLSRDLPSCTINTHFRDEYLIHPTQDRVITVREAARLQSFPDDFVFLGPKSREGQHGAVGNAVPPLMAKAIAVLIKEQLLSI